MPCPLPTHRADQLTLGVIVIHFALVFWWIWTSFAVVDEAAHLGSGYATWLTGDTRPYCVNPPLPRMIATLPIWMADPPISATIGGEAGVRPEWSLAASLPLNSSPDEYVRLTRLARLANLVWSVLLLFVLARWSGELYGPWGRFIAVALWCLEPTGIAYSGVVVPDVPATAAGLLASYVFWKYLRDPSWTMAWFAGLALGLALQTKLVWLILLAVWPILMIAARLHGAGTTGTVVLRPRFRHLLAMGLVAWLVFCSLYGFSKFGRPLGEFQFISKALGGKWEAVPGNHAMPAPGNRFHESALRNVPVPLPADAVAGIDIQKFDFERGLFSYMNGEWRQGGWWYYYLYAMAIKVPIPALILLLGGVFWCLVAPRSPGRVDEWAFLLPAIALLAFVSSQTGFNHHMRYVLPAFPLLFIAAGRLAPLAAELKWLRGIIAGLLIWCGTATISVAPYFMSYFNPLGGGPDNGWKRIVDSNIDWGQDLLHLQKWLEEHPEARPIGVQYYNLVEPKHAGIDLGRVPREPTPGWWALDVNFVAGSRFRVGGRGDGSAAGPYVFFQEFTPVAKAGYSIFIYHITEEEANRVRAEMGLPPWLKEAGGAR